MSRDKKKLSYLRWKISWRELDSTEERIVNLMTSPRGTTGGQGCLCEPGGVCGAAAVAASHLEKAGQDDQGPRADRGIHKWAPNWS